MQLSSADVELISKIGRARFESKRVSGISDKRSDGSRCSLENDIEATAAEYYAARYLQCRFNQDIYAHGDGGFDFEFKLKIEAIWLGIGKDGAPRRSGHLIVNPHEPQRWADLYVVVSGSVVSGFEISGWASHRQLTAAPRKDFGYGERFAMHVDDLNKNDIRKLKKEFCT